MAERGISIVMATRNSARYIREALASIPEALGEDVPFEVLVADASSTDETLEIVSGFRGARVVSRSDSGVYDGMNKAISAVSFPYVSILNSDDVLLKRALDVMQSALERQPEYHMASGGTLTGRHLQNAIESRHHGPLTPASAMFGIPAINARLFRTEVLQQVGPFRTDIGLAADRELLLRLLANGTVGVDVTEPVYFYRVHDGSHTIARDLAGRTRVYEAEAKLAASLLTTTDWGADIVCLARAAYALAKFKLRTVGRGRGGIAEGLPAPVRSPSLSDLATGLFLAWRWRGRLAGA